MVELAEPEIARRAAEDLLRALPGWFGLEEPLLKYVDAAAQLPTFVARNGGRVDGFLTLKEHTPVACEILAMGVLPDRHRQGVGASLVGAASEFAVKRGCRILQVKTLGPSHPSTHYARTRAFYEAMGFLPLEETDVFWGPANPCLILVKPIGAHD